MIVLSAVAVAPDRINLSWTDDYAAGPGYVLDRAQVAPSVVGPWITVTELGGAARAYSDAGVTPSTSYAYRLSRVAEAVTANATTPSGVTLPAVPSNLSAVAVSASQIDLAWTDESTNELGFKIDRWNGSVWIEIAAVAAGVTGYADTGLLAGTLYYYQVRAYNTTGSSAATPYQSATTLPVVVPAGLTLVGWRMDLGTPQDVKVIDGALYLASREFGLVVLNTQGVLRGVSDTLFPGWRVA